jgi:phosphohistidine phosphatase SixA
MRNEESVAIVGHEPMLSEFVGELLGSAGPAIVMTKGAVAILEVDDPKQLAAGESFPGSAASLVALIDPSWVDQGRTKR